MDADFRKKQIIEALENENRPGYLFALLSCWFTEKSMEYEKRPETKVSAEIFMIAGVAASKAQDAMDSQEKRDDYAFVKEPRKQS